MFRGTISSAKRIVDMVSVSPSGRTAARYSFERSTTRPMATLFSLVIAECSSAYGLTPVLSGTR